MGIVCPSCDAEPSSEQTAGGPCAACGTRLVIVDENDDLIGTVIDDRFEILGRLAAGGMGVVYRARQRSIDREVALKVLARHVEQDATSVKRFFREAKLASTLAHPACVQIIDFGQSADRRLYLAMELVRGHDLGQEIRRVGALPLGRVARIVTQLCDALEIAHGLTIVHRDLKPENVMLLDGGADQVKILDFGLARSLTDPSTRATATGLFSGTPRYMAPEVALEGAEPAPAQDMYAIGVILAELALGRPLWDAPTVAALFTQKLDTTEVIASIPIAIRALVEALLQSDPAGRPTAAQVRAVLRQISADAHAPAPAPARAPAAPAVALDRTADLALASLANPQLVSLAEHSAPPVSGVAAEPPSTLADAAAFEPPDPAIAAAPLELDPAWQATRPAAAGAIAHPPVAGGRPQVVQRGRSLVGYVLVAAALAAGGWIAYGKLRAKPAAVRAPVGSSVEIVISAPEPTPVEIDGHRAGKTPLRLQRPRGATPMLITAPGLTPVQVTPDRDQTVELAPTR